MSEIEIKNDVQILQNEEFEASRGSVQKLHCEVFAASFQDEKNF